MGRSSHGGPRRAPVRILGPCAVTRRRPPRWWLLGPPGAVLAARRRHHPRHPLGSRSPRPSRPTWSPCCAVGAGLGAAGVAWSLVTTRRPDGPAHRPGRARVVAVRVARRGGHRCCCRLALLWLRPLAGHAGGRRVHGRQRRPCRSWTRRLASSSDRTAPQPAPAWSSYPGALVDPRAYVPLLSTPLAAHGFTVVVVKPPYGIAFLCVRCAPVASSPARPAVTRWVVGGHSLGGVVAASYAGADHPGVRGLLLWASYPNGSIAGATSLAVTSVSAGNDGLATPARIAASRPDLPARHRVRRGARCRARRLRRLRPPAGRRHPDRHPGGGPGRDRIGQPGPPGTGRPGGGPRRSGPPRHRPDPGRRLLEHGSTTRHTSPATSPGAGVAPHAVA